MTGACSFQVHSYKLPTADYRFLKFLPGVKQSGTLIFMLKANRSCPQATVIPVLIYPDVRAAVAWLSGAFGFEERVKIGENHRSQLKAGDGAVAPVYAGLRLYKVAIFLLQPTAPALIPQAFDNE